ncbi:ferredoxin [Streptomyces marincola]|uniref:Ferredoxin n=1 Tax=Streptomyces marincola TaxID=2878388 RepID=A0A1W7CRS2_9ACTN|nr:ferredoxin [Streptomyces marincola]ARQ67447.1 ferredoxin [Streptomyces marincola]
MNVHLDQDKCVASGQCVLAAPGIFDQREEDGIAVLLDPAPPAGRARDLHDAEGLCPALAIRVDDAQGTPATGDRPA